MTRQADSSAHQGRYRMSSIHVDLLGTETRFIDTGKYRTRVISAPGDGEVVFLLHGGGGHAETYSRNMTRLAKVCQPYAIDFIWHGMSSRPAFSETPPGSKDHWLTQFTDQVLNLMDHLGIEKAVIEGESLGGWITYVMAINHPDRLNKVVAYGANYIPSGVNPDIGTNERFNAYIEQAAGDYQKLSADPSKWDAFLANIGNMWATEPNYTAEQLGTITTPILVLDGEEEEAILTSHTIEMQGLIPGSELHLIPGTGHFAMWEKPEEFNQIILDYLAK